MEYYSDFEEKEIIDFPVVPYSEKFNAGKVFIRGKNNGVYAWGYSESFSSFLGSDYIGFGTHPDQKTLSLKLKFLFLNYTSKSIRVMNFRESKLVFKNSTYLCSVIDHMENGKKVPEYRIPKILEINHKEIDSYQNSIEIPPLGFIVIENSYMTSKEEFNFFTKRQDLEYIEFNLTNFKSETVFLNEIIG